MKLSHEDILLRKIEEMKKGEFKATAIKIELEAQFNRKTVNRSVTCTACDGEGGENREDEDGDEEWFECETCDGEGMMSTSVFRDTSYCHDWIMERMSKLGLSERGTLHMTAHHQYSSEFETDWHPKAPLTFAEFYNDGSVDSEFTFTLMLNDGVTKLIPQIVAIFTDLGKAIGGGMELDKAGMHLALLQDPEGLYPSSHNDGECYVNYKRSMSLLLPALFFLASKDETSRGLRFRAPRIARGSDSLVCHNPKWSAIYYNGGALEFRLFETCYDNPETIMDNIVVMANTLRYWSKKYRPSGLTAIAPMVKFGSNYDNTISRFYKTKPTIQLLNAGLRKLKPSYYTIRQLKEQRKFTMDCHQIRKMQTKVSKRATEEYKSYEKSYDWDQAVIRHRVIAQLLENYRYTADDRSPDEALLTLEIDEYIAERYSPKQSLTEFTQDFIRRFNAQNEGTFELREA